MVMENYISQRELIDTLENAGITTNEFLLISWRKRGAITHRKRGLGKGKGSIVQYPASTVQQVKRLLEHLEEKRSLDLAIYRLWLEGYPVNLRKVIKQDLRKYERLFDKVSEGLWWKKDGVIGEYGKKRLPPGFLKSIRREFGRYGFDFLLETLLVTITGTALYNNENIRAFMQLLPTNYLNHDETERALKSAVLHLSPEHLNDVLGKTRDEDFRVAYNNLEIVKNIIGESIPIFGEMKRVCDWDSPALSLGLLLCLSVFEDKKLLEIVLANQKEKLP